MTPHFDKLITLYATMDAAWDKTAAQYGFQCLGCKDNCCFSLFFHHTHVEKAYLIHGLKTLSPEDQDKITAKSKTYCTANRQESGSKKQPCPLLRDGRCGLYQFRPMICRMHGLPHELHKPGYEALRAPGCQAGHFEDQRYIPFDRTPFYREMASIEMGYRSDLKKNGKIKETIAQMILNSD